MNRLDPYDIDDDNTVEYIELPPPGSSADPPLPPPPDKVIIKLDSVFFD